MSRMFRFIAIAHPRFRCSMLLMIDNHASFTEQGLFPAALAVTAWTEQTCGTPVGERR